MAYKVFSLRIRLSGQHDPYASLPHYFYLHREIPTTIHHRLHGLGIRVWRLCEEFAGQGVFEENICAEVFGGRVVGGGDCGFEDAEAGGKDLAREGGGSEGGGVVEGGGDSVDKDGGGEEMEALDSGRCWGWGFVRSLGMVEDWMVARLGWYL